MTTNWLSSIWPSAREHLAAIETCLLAIEKGGAEIDEELVNRAFRAVHSVKGGAGVFDLVKIGELAHQTENVLALIRSREMVPTPDRVRVLLRATDRLRELIQNPDTSNQADIAEIMAALARLLRRSPGLRDEGQRFRSRPGSTRRQASAGASGGRRFRQPALAADLSFPLRRMSCRCEWPRSGGGGSLRLGARARDTI